MYSELSFVVVHAGRLQRLGECWPAHKEQPRVCSLASGSYQRAAERGHHSRHRITVSPQSLTHLDLDDMSICTIFRRGSQAERPLLQERFQSGFCHAIMLLDIGIILCFDNHYNIAISRRVQRCLGVCRGRPKTVLAALAAGGVLYLSVFDTLLLLRWLGTFALLFTAFNRVVSYSSPNVSIPSHLRYNTNKNTLYGSQQPHARRISLSCMHLPGTSPIFMPCSTRLAVSVILHRLRCSGTMPWP